MTTQEKTAVVAAVVAVGTLIWTIVVDVRKDSAKSEHSQATAEIRADAGVSKVVFAPPVLPIPEPAAPVPQPAGVSQTHGVQSPIIHSSPGASVRYETNSPAKKRKP